MNATMNRSERLQAFRDGVVDSLSLLFGLIPWAIIAGAATVAAGLTPLQAIGMSLAYAGSVQIALLPLLIVKAPLWVMLVTAVVVNLRYVIYSASVAPYFSELPLRWRVVLSYLTVDGGFALFIARYRERPHDESKRWYYLGSGVLLWALWQVFNWVGIFAGSLIPKSWSLEFAATLALVALLIPLLYDFAVVCGALAAATTALVAGGLPFNLGLICAVAVGVAVGMTVAAMRAPKAGS